MLSADDLLSSPIVANAIMNRGRGFSGVNSYERELRFDISRFLEQRVQEHGTVLWLDVCCGEGRALIEAGTEIRQNGLGRFGRNYRRGFGGDVRAGRSTRRPPRFRRCDGVYSGSPGGLDYLRSWAALSRRQIGVSGRCFSDALARAASFSDTWTRKISAPTDLAEPYGHRRYAMPANKGQRWHCKIILCGSKAQTRRLILEFDFRAQPSRRHPIISGSR